MDIKKITPAEAKEKFPNSTKDRDVRKLLRQEEENQRETTTRFGVLSDGRLVLLVTDPSTGFWCWMLWDGKKWHDTEGDLQEVDPDLFDALMENDDEEVRWVLTRE